MKPDTVFAFKENLIQKIMQYQMDERSNSVLIPEANIHLIKEAESSVNDKENNVESEQEITKKGKNKGKEKAKKKKHMEFNWSKRPKSNQKQPSDLEVERFC